MSHSLLHNIATVFKHFFLKLNKNFKNRYIIAFIYTDMFQNIQKNSLNVCV